MSGAPAAGRLARLRYPRRIVVAGASASRPNMGRRLLTAAGRSFGGDLVAIHPSASSIGEHRCVPDLAALSHQPVDVLVVAVPAAGVPALIAQSADLNPAAVLVVTAVDAATLTSSVTTAFGKKYDPLQHPWVIGPGSNGYLSGAAGLAVTSNPSVTDVPVTDRGVLIIGQSGGLALSALWEPLGHAGVPVGTVLTTGAQAVLPWWVVAGDGLRGGQFDAVAVLAEDVPDAPTMVELGQASQEHGIPLIALHVGRSSAGGQVAQSHSGALATPGRLFEAACLSNGIRPARSLPELVDLAGAATAGQRSRILDTRTDQGVAVVSPSGGALSYALDQLDAAQLRLAPLSDATLSRLAPLLDPSVSPRNPLDLGAAAATDPSTLRDAVRMLVADPTVSRVVVVLAAAAGFPEAVGLLASDDSLPPAVATTPVDVVCLGADPAMTRSARQQASARPSLRLWSDLSAVAAAVAVEPRLAASTTRGSVADTADTPFEATPDADLAAAAGLVAGWATGARTEDEGAQLLRVLGIGRPREVRLEPPTGLRAESLAALRDDLPLPWVVKGMAPDATHKRAAGLLATNVHTIEEARARIEAFRAVRPDLTGLLIQEHVTGYGGEYLLAVRQHPSLGPHLLLGAGGSAVEETDNISICLLPASTSEVAELLRAAVPGPGGTPTSSWLSEVVATVSRLTELLHACTAASTGLTVELNPVIQDPRNGRLVALDVLCIKGGVPS